MEHSNNPRESFLHEAGQWIDFFGPAYPIKKGPESFLRARDINVRRLATDSRYRLDLVKNLALYIGRLWLCDPAKFSGQPPALVAPPAEIPDHKRGSVKYDKEVLEILIDRCARLPRQENTGYYMPYSDRYEYDLDFLYTPAISDDKLIDTIVCYSEALWYDNDPDQILDILLSAAWELYLRVWEPTAH